MWLAAENGMFLRHTHGEWMTTMPEPLNMDWVESVQLVFDYFCERTPRSFVETRETSLVWNYKYADGEFGRVQARNMLQHLWTGPISNAAVDVVQGSKSVEVRPVGVSKVCYFSVRCYYLMNFLLLYLLKVKKDLKSVCIFLGHSEEPTAHRPLEACGMKPSVVDCWVSPW
jgi:trehalose-6-phosphatase